MTLRQALREWRCTRRHPHGPDGFYKPRVIQANPSGSRVWLQECQACGRAARAYRHKKRAEFIERFKKAAEAVEAAGAAAWAAWAAWAAEKRYSEVLERIRDRARAAAKEKLGPTVSEMQTSAFELLDKMIGEKAAA